ncbi:uncharacterized protein LOC110461030 [Mizuhopecten yessoensis]|uniref:Uncharacterized protein n=1 Tax=Mizuhopecten yessoensis TaxID=6573 RepID=A0A210Q147_MIZYE|nr:uncharacterized protein LOC110461030 [Mizuhopecten yessoensis]OWF42458.1 hypothetical protein KP79_PYT02053 [Mizuhopecten yessoensis]
MHITQTYTGYTSAVLIIALSVSLQIHFAESRSLSTDEYFPNTIFKRNSWFSKKSMDNLPPASQKQIDITPMQMESGCEEALSVYKCYADVCVPEFVECSRTSMSNDLYEMCKLEHSMCASRCFNGSGPEMELK